MTRSIYEKTLTITPSVVDLLDGFVAKTSEEYRRSEASHEYVPIYLQRHDELIRRGYGFFDLTKRHRNALRKSGVRCGWVGRRSAWVPRWAYDVLRQPRGQYIKTLKLLRDDPLARQLLESHPDTLEALMRKP